MSSTESAKVLASAVERYAQSELPTEYGLFQVIVYRERAGQQEHCAVVCGELAGREKVLLRVHSECFTGEVLHSLKCDCREQLSSAMRLIQKEGRGVVLYLRQEGRGIGLGNKIRAYALQEQGHDTVQANRLLGFDDDLRDYKVAANMLEDLGVRSVRLITNNPSKVQALNDAGIVVDSRVPSEVASNPHNEGYLQTKRDKMGHLL